MGKIDLNALPSECIVCGAYDWSSLYTVLQQCRECAFVRADVTVDLATLDQLYCESYFHGHEYGDYLADRDIHRRTFARRLSDMRTAAGEPRSVFEIGCAYGFWLELLTENDIQCAGVDISPAPVQYAVGQLRQNATCGDFLSLDIEPGRFDAFCMWDTIEHLSRPELYLQRIFDLLPGGGTLAFTTGDIGSRYARWRGRRWRMIHPPTHLQYFSRDTARRLLERYGFRDIQVQSTAIYRTLHSVLGSLAALNRGVTRSMARSLHRVLPNSLQQRVGAWTNLGDIMFVSAKTPTKSAAPKSPASPSGN